MLIATIITLFLLGGHTSATMQQIDALPKLIKEHVPEHAHQVAAVAIVETMKKQEAAAQKRIASAREGVEKLLAVRATPDSVIAAAARSLFGADSAASARLIDEQFKLRKQLTAAEWAKVFPPPPPPAVKPGV